MKSLFLRAAAPLALAFLAASLPGCVRAGPATPADAGGGAPTDADPALWVVKDEDTTIYLFGTIHVLRPGLGWFDEAVRDAFDRSDTLVLEMVEPEPAQMMALVGRLGIAADGVPLRERLAQAERSRYEAAMRGLGMDAAMLDRFEPWMAAVNLTYFGVANAGYDPASGAEKALGAAARDAGKQVIGLETAEQQLGYFDSLPMATQVTFLNATTEQIGTVREGMEDMVAAWSRGDADRLGVIMQEGLSDPLVHRTLITDRNRNWAAWLDARMDTPGTVFVAVGAGHLAGKDSVQALLATAGHRAERVAY